MHCGLTEIATRILNVCDVGVTRAGGKKRGRLLNKPRGDPIGQRLIQMVDAGGGASPPGNSAPLLIRSRSDVDDLRAYLSIHGGPEALGLGAAVD